MLNGVVDYGADGDWSVRINDGALELSNSEAEHALRYYTVPTVSYPGSGSVSDTDGAIVEVEVRVEAHGRAGAGIVAGFDRSKKDYLLFATGAGQQVYVVRRTHGKARMLTATTNDAVKEGEMNRLRVSRTDGGLALDINGARVMMVSSSDVPGRGIGIGAFGTGTFSFDEVLIQGAFKKIPAHPTRVPTELPNQ
ncbi:MAG TPA: hypothetical protein VFG44_08255 [Burkholderiales bacterium]|nr:hypothetical protein [Burkholderiales bacterium]